MVLDKAQFSDAQALTSSSSEAATDIIDCQYVGSANLGKGTPIWLVAKVNTAFTADTSGTLIVGLKDCATSGGTYAVIAQSATYTVGQLVKGFDALTIPLPARTREFLQVYYTKGVSSGFTTGKMDAFLTLNAPRA